MADIFPFPVAYAYTCSTLSSDDGDWTFQPFLRVNELIRGALPTRDQASLEWDVGYQNRQADDVQDSFTDYVGPLDLYDSFVRIVVPAHGVEWYGYCPFVQGDRGPEETFGGAQRVLVGQQGFMAVGLGWFLERETVNFSIVKGTPDLRIERGIGFNTGFGRRRSATYEKRENMDAGGLVFAKTPTGAALWTATKAVRYLLNQHGPKSTTPAHSPCEFKLSGDADPYLDWFKPTLETEGRSVWQLLNEIINPKRGLVGWIYVDRGEARDLFDVYLNVSSMATADIALPGGATLPEAQVLYDYGAADARELSVQIQQDRARYFDQVVCRGARKRAVMTLSFKSENLVKSWDSAEETYYKVAAAVPDAQTNDLFRLSNRMERVYQMFHVPDTWNGASNDGSGPPDPSKYSCPKIAQGSGSIVGLEPIAMPGLRLLRTLPTKVGWDYDNATAPVNRDPSGLEPEHQRPFGVVDVGNGKWRFIDKLTSTKEKAATGNFKTAYHVRVLDTVAGIQLSPGSGMPHCLAKGHFVPASASPTQMLPEVDYENMRFTVGGEWDAYCEGVWPLDLSGLPVTRPVQRLYVSIGNRARHDWLAEGTIYDVQNGVLKTVTTGGALRDDRTLCAQVARIAFDWYSQDRNALTMTTVGETLGVHIGDLVLSIGTAEAQQPVNSIVSQIHHDFKNGQAIANCGFVELDFRALL